MEKDCKTPFSTQEMRAPMEVLSTPIDGFLLAEVVNPSIAKKYQICLLVSDSTQSITVPNIELDVIDCSSALSLAKNFIKLFV